LARRSGSSGYTLASAKALVRNDLCLNVTVKARAARLGTRWLGLGMVALLPLSSEGRSSEPGHRSGVSPDVSPQGRTVGETTGFMADTRRVAPVPPQNAEAGEEVVQEEGW
jgi:hypothetical protein